MISPKSDRVAFVKDRASGSFRSTARLRRSGCSSRAATAARLNGRRMVRVSGLFPVAAIIRSSASTQTTRLRSSISRHRLRAIRARAGRLTESESRLCDDRETAARRSRSSNKRPQAWSIWTADAATGEGKSTLEEPVHVARLASDYARRNKPALGRRRSHRLSLVSRRLAASLLDPGKRRRAVVADARQLHGRVHLDQLRSRYLVFAGNAGTDADDIDRRHIVKVPVDKAEPVVLTPGKGLEWTPFVTGDGKYIAYLAATAQRPPLPTVMPVAGGGKADNTRGRSIPIGFSLRINWSCRRKWSTKRPMASTFTRSCLKPQVARRRSRRSFTFMVVHRGRCCSAGTTPITTQTPTR